MKAFITALAFLLATATAQAQIPRTISFQGVLADVNGNAVPDGVHQLKLTLYEAPTGGAAVYCETQTLSVAKGVFNAVIGAVTPIPPSLGFDRAYFLAVAVDGSADLAPRTALTAVPYALRASTADIAQSLAPNATGVVTRVNGQSGDLTLEGAGSTTVTKSGNTIRISSTGGGGTGIAGVQSVDGTIAIQNPNGPVATLGLADGAVTGAKIAPAGIEASKISGAGAQGGQTLTWNGASTVWATPPVGVSSVNGSGGALTMNGAGAVSVTTNGSTITVGGGGAQSIASPLGSLDVANPNGPMVSLDIAAQGVKAGMVAPKAIDSSHINPGSAPNGYVLSTKNGTACWAPALSLPFFATVTSSSTGLAISQSGTGPCLAGMNSGLNGEGALFLVSNPNSTASALRATTSGKRFAAEFENLSANSSATTLFCRTYGGGFAGQFEVDNATSTGAAIFARVNGLGNAGVFSNENSSNTFATIAASTEGKGTVLYINHAGSSGDLATFAVSYANKARIDRTGKGFFNGGTQSSGADVAEALAVEGQRNAYAPGDVLAISTRSDRTMEKSSVPYSTLVAGVFATKPGVLLTEASVDADLSATVPMAVVGIVPTSVCTENGPIRRGDLLVTSSTPGCAMKADPSRIVPGCLLGKALQDFDADRAGTIKILLSVK
jgi:hypothetical protein